MAPKRTSAATSSSPAAPASQFTPSQSSAAQPSRSSKNDAQYDAAAIAQKIWSNYVKQTPARTKLLDVFLGFLAVVGALQFLYVIIVGNFPFNAFLSGFSACVGQFVLTVSLRIQTNPENKKEFESISNERAFADFVFGSLILHFFCVNFIN